MRSPKRRLHYIEAYLRYVETACLEGVKKHRTQYAQQLSGQVNRIAPEALGQDFNGYVTVQPGIAGAVDLTDAAEPMGAAISQGPSRVPAESAMWIWAILPRPIASDRLGLK